MKRILYITATLLAGLCVVGGTVGCNIKAASPPPLPTGAYDQTDAKANEFLQSAHAFSDVASSGKLTAAQADILNKLNIALNGADKAEQTYQACLKAIPGNVPNPTAGPNSGCLAASGLNGLLSAAQAAFGTAETAITPTAP